MIDLVLRTFLTATLFACCAGSPALSSLPQTIEPTPTRMFFSGYPRPAHLAGTSGTVHLTASISADGAVNSTRVDSGPGLLADGAKRMLAKWLFSKCTDASGLCEAHVTFRFILDEGICDGPDCPNDIQVDTPSIVTIRSKLRRAIVN
jgi:TonB-like protein